MYLLPMPPTPAPRIRAAVAGDAAAIAATHVASWRRAYAGLLPEAFLAELSTERRARMWHARIMERSERRTWVLLESGTVVGFAATDPSRDADDDPSRVAELAAIYLEPALFGRGFGARLFDHAERDVAGRGFSSLTLWVLEDNRRARRFYEGRSMALDGATKTVSLGGQDLVEVRYRKAF